MRIISRKTLKDYCDVHPEIKSQIDSWYYEVKHADWGSPNDVRNDFPKARIIGKTRIIFNILNNRFRLIAKVNFKAKIVYIRFIGTHKEYDKIEVDKV